MAYKFQLGDSVMSGTLTQEGDLIVQNGGDSNLGFFSSSAGLKLSSTGVVSAPSQALSLSITDLLQIDGITAGTVAASKAVVVDSNKDADGFRNLSASALVECADVIASIKVATATLSASAGLQLKGAGTIVAPGVSLNVTDLLQIDGITAGTVAASKAVVVDSNKDATGFRDISGRNLSGSGDGRFMAIDLDSTANVLTKTALGSTVLASSLTSVGTIVGMTASGPSQFQILKTTGLLSGSTADVGGRLRAGLGNFVVDADGDVSAKSLLSNSTISGSGNATFAGKIEGNGGFELFGIPLDANYAQAEDGVYYRDATTGEMKASTNDAFLIAIAGAGISVSGNKLVADAGAAPVARGDANVTLTEAFNFGSTTLTANRNWTLPAAPTNGDIVRIKAPASMGAGSDKFTINVTGSGAQIIDGQGSVLLESPGSAISLIYAGSNAWLLF